MTALSARVREAPPDHHQQGCERQVMYFPPFFAVSQGLRQGQREGTGPRPCHHTKSFGSKPAPIPALISLPNFKATNSKAQPRAVLLPPTFFSSSFLKVLKEAEILDFSKIFSPTLSLRKWKTLCLKHTVTSKPLVLGIYPFSPCGLNV